MQRDADALRRAASMLLSWSDRDMTGLARCLAEMRTKNEAIDTAIALVLLSDTGDIPGICAPAAFRETT